MQTAKEFQNVYYIASVESKKSLGIQWYYKTPYTYKTEILCGGVNMINY